MAIVIEAIDFENCELAPIFIDWDYVQNRPRGASAKLDLFSHGALTAVMKEITPKGQLFLRKMDLFIEQGFFLVDYSTHPLSSQAFAEMVRGLGVNHIYMDKPTTVHPGEPSPELHGIGVTYLDFA